MTPRRRKDACVHGTAVKTFFTKIPMSSGWLEEKTERIQESYSLISSGTSFGDRLRTCFSCLKDHRGLGKIVFLDRW